jgi:hypothetical protein
MFPIISDQEKSVGDRRGLGGLLGLQLPDYLERVADVLVDVGHRVEDVPLRVPRNREPAA